MKSEVVIIIALAAALSFHRRDESPACGSSGCLLIPMEFVEHATALAGEADVPVVEFDRGALR